MLRELNSRCKHSPEVLPQCISAMMDAAVFFLADDSIIFV